jgi:hypothetical protein
MTVPERNKSNKTALAALVYLIFGNFACPADEAVNRVKIVRIPGDSKVVKAQIGADDTIHVLSMLTTDPIT